MKKGIGALLIAVGLFICHSSQTPSENYLRNRVVKLVDSQHSCSGEQVVAPSGVSYILTAGHCSTLAVDGSIKVMLDDGKSLMRRVIAEDGESDLLLLEGLPNVHGISIASSQIIGEHIRTLTHGHGYKTYLTEGEIIDQQEVKARLYPISIGAGGSDDLENEDVKKLEEKCSSQHKNKVIDIDAGFFQRKACALDVNEMVTTAFVSPGSSGGMVVNDRGQLTGVVSTSGDGYGYLVRLSDIQSFLHAY